MAVELPLSSARLRRAVEYWESRRAGRRMPAWRDIDPLDVPDLLPWLLVIDVLPGAADFRYRLIGTKVVAIARQDFTGRLFSELPGKGPGSVVWENCRQVASTGGPFSRTPPYAGPDPQVRLGENVLLPLSDDGRTVDRILQAISYGR